MQLIPKMSGFSQMWYNYFPGFTSNIIKLMQSNCKNVFRVFGIVPQPFVDQCLIEFKISIIKYIIYKFKLKNGCYGKTGETSKFQTLI